MKRLLNKKWARVLALTLLLVLTLAAPAFAALSPRRTTPPRPWRPQRPRRPPKILPV